MHAIITDRYEGLLEDADSTASELYLDLIRSLRALAEGTARRQLADSDVIVDSLLDGIRQQVLDWAAGQV